MLELFNASPQFAIVRMNRCTFINTLEVSGRSRQARLGTVRKEQHSL